MMEKYFIENWPIIQKKYEEGVLCSERHFQAELFHVLYTQKDFVSKYRLFIEPIIYSDNELIDKNELRGIIPDMIATEGNKIKAIIELKYVPHSYVSYKKDIRNMSKFYRCRMEQIPFYLISDTKTGQWNKNEKFYLDEDLILIYGLIGRHDSFCITNPLDTWKEEFSSESPNFIQLVGSINAEIGQHRFYKV